MKSMILLMIAGFLIGDFGYFMVHGHSIIWGNIFRTVKASTTPREYTIIVTRTPAPAQIIGRIQVGLTKAEAEGAAFQLNELFSKEKLEWKAVATLPEAIK